MSPLKRFYRLLELDKKDISYIYLYAVFGGLIALTLPLGIQAIIGLIAGGNISSSWIVLITVVTIGTALSGILKVMQLTVTEVIQQRIFARSAFDLAYRIPKMKLESIAQEYPPELVNRFFDTLTLQKGLPKILMDFSTSILQIFFGLLLISFYHPFFIFFGFILIMMILVIFRITGPRGLSTSLMESKYKYEVASWLEELARTMGTFKLAGESKLPLQQTDGLVVKYLDARKKHFKVLVAQYISIVTFKVLITAGLLILGSILVIDNRINLGQFVAAEIVVLLITNSVEKLILTTEIIYDVLTALEKIGSLTDIPIEKEEGVCYDEIDTGKGIAVQLNDITYQFEDAEYPTLHNFSLDIKASEKVLIAGYNSSGKSTLIRIITGLYHKFKGSIVYNGIPLRDLNAVSLRGHIGDHIPQEDIFKGTLLDNICLGHKKVSLEDVVDAIEKVGLGDFVRKLPDGFHTVLLPGGKNLPRSVVSRIILARSIASKPDLLAIEETFSFLEKEERLRIIKMLTSREAKWTLLVVSDDPLLAADCDRIIIMKDGQIVEEGPYERVCKSAHFKNVFKSPEKPPSINGK